MAKLIGVAAATEDAVPVGLIGSVVVRAVRYVPVEGEPEARPGVGSVWCAWLDGGQDLGSPATGRSGVTAGLDRAWLVDERPQWDGGPLDGAVTRFSFLRAAPGVSREEFGDHWRDRHAPLARRYHPALWRYVQNVVIRPLIPGTPELDGIAELTFATVTDLDERMYDSGEGRRVIGEDVRRFIDVRAGWRVVTRVG